jgi:glycosyltransferase involved in cell wall biosynthesis
LFQMKDGVSVVICCYNSADKISQALTCLQEQEYDQSILWEVILVDNASDDNTAIVARQIWKHLEIPLRILNESQKGLSNARKKGINESNYN